MLTSAKEILTHAKEKKYGVVAPDLWDLNTGRDYVQIAEELNAPLILSFAEAHQHLISLEEAAVIGSYLASSVKTPISLHLDHGTDFEYIKKAISLGFNSVMIDASMYSFEENVRRTKEVVDYAHAHNVSVEAEIGHVGGTTETLAEQSSGESVYTTVEEAAAFIEQTKAGSLAVSIGTSHGVYKNQKNPTLNFDRLHELANTIPVPLVLHGGSGTGDDNLKKCIAGGIAKVNVFTEFTTATLTGAQKAIAEGNLKSFMRVQELADIEVKKVLRHYIKLLTLKEI